MLTQIWHFFTFEYPGTSKYRPIPGVPFPLPQAVLCRMTGPVSRIQAIIKPKYWTLTVGEFTHMSNFYKECFRG